MFAYIDGILDFAEDDLAVLDVNGVGYNIIISSRTLSLLPGCGERVKLYTYTAVREDAFLLYGFLSRAELNLFKMLITVNGIGPKGGLSILSAFDPEELKFAILSQDAKTISKAPGIGLKTAERLIVDLKNKVDMVFYDGSSSAKALKAPTKESEEYRDAIEGLMALGYSGTDATRAVNSLGDIEGLTAAKIVRAALKKM
ncbi:MAG: Holliday junction branch migration protein RuvA [Acetatifactor sp.]|nr:Holliday junction branch migration protein RuvA [Acetatifactor sp.]